MSPAAKTLHQIAENDTPAGVEVPSSLTGLVMWLIGRFGGGVVIALAALYGLNQVYADLREEMRANREVQMQTIRTLTELTGAVKDVLKSQP